MNILSSGDLDLFFKITRTLFPPQQEAGEAGSGANESPQHHNQVDARTLYTNVGIDGRKGEQWEEEVTSKKSVSRDERTENFCILRKLGELDKQNKRGITKTFQETLQLLSKL